MRLCVAVLEGDVAQALGFGDPPGAFEDRCGHVHTQCASVAGGAGGFTGGLARTAADVDHLVAGAHIGSGAEVHVVAAQLRVIEVSVAGVLHCHGANGPSRSTPRTVSKVSASGENSGSHQVAPAST